MAPYGVVLQVHECMRDRAQWVPSVTLTFCLAFLYYGGLGIFGYNVFGMDLEASTLIGDISDSRFCSLGLGPGPE